jgi:hypothetical protein
MQCVVSSHVTCLICSCTGMCHVFVKVTLRLMISRSVRLGVEARLGLMTGYSETSIHCFRRGSKKETVDPGKP